MAVLVPAQLGAVHHNPNAQHRQSQQGVVPYSSCLRACYVGTMPYALCIRLMRALRYVRPEIRAITCDQNKEDCDGSPLLPPLVLDDHVTDGKNRIEVPLAPYARATPCPVLTHAAATRLRCSVRY
eukprot:52458-Rhodomonas_salina.3